MAATATFLESVLDSSPSESSRYRHPDPVPSRVAYHHPLTEYEKLQAERALEDAQSVGAAPKGRFALPPLVACEDAPQTATTRLLQGRHVGDIVYWVACLGGACLLLLCATH
jgi:hypothetical protein